MKRFTTILCSIAFMIAGFVIAFMKPPESHNQLHAAPVAPIILSRSALPLDLQLDLAKHDSAQIRKDTIVLHDTVRIVKYKYKYRTRKKAVEPDSLLSPAKPDTLQSLAKSDTLYVPKLKILIQMSKDVLMDTTFTVIPDSVECPQIQPLQERGE